MKKSELRTMIREEYSKKLTENQWDDVPDAFGAKSDIYTLFMRKTKVKDAREKIIKRYPKVTPDMFNSVWYHYKSEK